MSEKKENLLLASLPREERERLAPFLEWTEVEFGQTLLAPDEPIRQVFFPFDAVTSTIQEYPDGSTIETGLMGLEGMVGIQLWLRVPSTPMLTTVQVQGRGHRMSAADFVREVRDRPSPLNGLIARYTHAFLVMTSVTAGCNRLHTLDQRMCRWLKLIHDRARQDEFPMRQEFMAQMLGVQRPTVSTTANILQRAGLISYTRGRMTVLDPEGLVAGSCECYGLLLREVDRIFEAPASEAARRGDERRG